MTKSLTCSYKLEWFRCFCKLKPLNSEESFKSHLSHFKGCHLCCLMKCLSLGSIFFDWWKFCLIVPFWSSWSLALQWFKGQIGSHAFKVLLIHWFVQFKGHFNPLTGSKKGWLLDSIFKWSIWEVTTTWILTEIWHSSPRPMSNLVQKLVVWLWCNSDCQF